MITLIVNADDFGLSRGVNNGIIDSHLYGIVTSTTMMMNQPGTDHAVALAKKHPSLNVGIHLVLTSGRPLLDDVPSLANEDGNFYSLREISTHEFDLVELEREWSAQIEKFLDSGLQPTHFDSHHHVHTHEKFLPIVQRLSQKYGLPARVNRSTPIPGITPFSDISLSDFYGDGVDSDFFSFLPGKVDDGMTVEVMCHPAYLDNTLLNKSSYTHKRLDELDILTHVTLPDNLYLLKKIHPGLPIFSQKQDRLS